MKEILKNSKVFLIPFIVIWVLVFIPLQFYTKAEIHLFLNSYHSEFANGLFKVSTYFGDGLSPVFFGLVFLFISFRNTIILGLTAIFSGLLAQFFKRFVFSDLVRPAEYFKGVEELYFVPGVEIHSFHSFPSGHTTTAFCLAFCLAYFTKNKWLKVGYFSLALLAGYSRIYLSQHFLVDVYFGAILGIVVAIAGIFYFNKIQKGKIDNSLRTVFNKS